MTIFNNLHDKLVANPTLHKVVHRGERLAHLIYFAGVAGGFGYKFAAAALFVLTAVAWVILEEEI